MQKEKILIVDDEQINLDFFDVMLSKLGFQVERAEDGEEALQMVKTVHPDLIILDNIMPRLSGWEVTKALKTDPGYEDFRDVPVIMFSAMDDVKDKIEGFELGVEDYITKPFNFSEVLARIKAVLRSRDLTQQVLKREKRISLVESLNKSLVFFTKHVKQPVQDLLDAAKTLKTDDEKAVEAFVDMVKSESEETLATISGLEEQISDLLAQGDQMKEDELSVESLERKYEKHFKAYKEKARNLNEVTK
ncbi:response regulator transcription factor [Spirochaeta lutea]|uniref:Histidine kinase n=1 Tax=Spirochaeta lutea TaxID=1480694 RepID=A0A098R1T5_9SPIO|nr:response regulator [Spirochaeta lutea]KGE73633.1 histidine kinase [Spirochaeta lutea]